MALDSRDFIHDDSPTDLDKMFRDSFLETGCYEEVMKSIFHTDALHIYRYRYIYRVKPHCAHRMVKRGYMHNPENKSLGKGVDFERAYLGLKSPLLENVQKIKQV